MLKRSSKKRPDEDDPNEPPIGPVFLAPLIGELRTEIEAGATDEDIALRLWPQIIRMSNAARKARLRSAAAELGSMGGKKGGKARAKALSAERRYEIAKKAALARWSKSKDT